MCKNQIHQIGMARPSFRLVRRGGRVQPESIQWVSVITSGGVAIERHTVYPMPEHLRSDRPAVDI